MYLTSLTHFYLPKFIPRSFSLKSHNSFFLLRRIDVITPVKACRPHERSLLQFRQRALVKAKFLHMCDMPAHLHDYLESGFIFGRKITGTGVPPCMDLTRANWWLSLKAIKSDNIVSRSHIISMQQASIEVTGWKQHAVDHDFFPKYSSGYSCSVWPQSATMVTFIYSSWEAGI